MGDRQPWEPSARELAEGWVEHAQKGGPQRVAEAMRADDEALAYWTKHGHMPDARWVGSGLRVG